MKVSNVGSQIGSINKAQTEGVDKTSFESLKKQEAVKKGDVSSSADVQISQKAKDITKAMELARPTNEVDEQKVAYLQKLIDEGAYQVDAEAVADNILSEHTMMPSE